MLPIPPAFPRWAEAAPPPSFIPPGFTYSIHIAPADPTRLYTHSFLRPSDSPSTRSTKLAHRRAAEAVSLERDKARRGELAREVGERGYRLHEGAERGEEGGREVWMVVRRLRRVRRDGTGAGRAGRDGRDGKGGVTMVCCQANGLPVEGFLQPLAAADLSAVSDIYLLEAINHGASASLNFARLGSVYSWTEHARDVAFFVERVMPLDSGVGPSRIGGEERRVMCTRDKGRRENIVGVGHSFGACALAVAQMHNPGMFSALLLLEPMIVRDPQPEMRRRLYEGALLRRTRWPSRGEARSALGKSPMFKAMDPAQLEGYVRWGLRPVAEVAGGAGVEVGKRGQGDEVEVEGEVTLATPNWCEALTFSDAWTSFETFRDLRKLRGERGVWLVDAARSMPNRGGEEVILAVRDCIAGSKGIWVDCGHLVVHERPDEVARILSDLLREAYGQDKRRREARL